MHMKSIVSAGALAIALGLVGPSFAQDAAATSTMTYPMMIGGQEITEADSTAVKTYCEDLSNQENAAEGSTNDDVDEEASEEAGGAADTATVGSVDMDLITLENCVEAGFVNNVGN